MRRANSKTRQHILDTAVVIIGERGSQELHIAELAERAEVGVPTVYYHFESRTQLVAEAQAAIYFNTLLPLHQYLGRAEAALDEGDREGFLDALGQNLVLAFSPKDRLDAWDVVKLLLDVWSDPKTQRDFSERLDVQFDRWCSIAEKAKGLGWLDESLDVRAAVTTFWSASIGVAIFSSSELAVNSPLAIRDFFLYAVAPRPRHEETDNL